MSRRLVREKVIQALYELEFQPQQLDRVLAAQKSMFSSEDFAYFIRLVKGVLEAQSSIDQLIAPYLKQGWSLARISILERSILRLATYELQNERDTPPKVVINEAVELAKQFGDKESNRFINGILGKWIRESQNSHE